MGVAQLVELLVVVQAVVGSSPIAHLPAEYGGVFEPLKDPAYFARLRADAEAGTIVWPNDADVAPETLYARAASDEDRC